jgi:DNA-binding transcriptional MerR regulator
MDRSKKLFTMSAVSRAADVPESTIRNWSDRKLLDCDRDSAGRRLYGVDAIERARELREERTRP